jgi:hypothetical protein
MLLRPPDVRSVHHRSLGAVTSHRPVLCSLGLPGRLCLTRPLRSSMHGAVGGGCERRESALPGVP